jgi:hypothetical protein
MPENYENTKAKARIAASAMHAAAKRLREAHPDEYLEYYLEEAKARGMKSRIKPSA